MVIHYRRNTNDQQLYEKSLRNLFYFVCLFVLFHFNNILKKFTLVLILLKLCSCILLTVVNCCLKLLINIFGATPSLNLQNYFSFPSNMIFLYVHFSCYSSSRKEIEIEIKTERERMRNLSRLCSDQNKLCGLPLSFSLCAFGASLIRFSELQSKREDAGTSLCQFPISRKKKSVRFNLV